MGTRRPSNREIKRSCLNRTLAITESCDVPSARGTGWRAELIAEAAELRAPVWGVFSFGDGCHWSKPFRSGQAFFNCAGFVPKTNTLASG